MTGSTHEATSPSLPETVHEILVAWQAGRIGWRRAVDLVGVPGLPELYDAAHSSGVPVRKTLLPQEKRAAARAVTSIRQRLARQADEPGK